MVAVFPNNKKYKITQKNQIDTFNECFSPARLNYR